VVLSYKLVSPAVTLEPCNCGFINLKSGSNALYLKKGGAEDGGLGHLQSTERLGAKLPTCRRIDRG
jgi:hypothetical protein